MSNFDPTLGELERIQAVFDVENFTGAETLEDKRRHVFLHLGKLLGKFAGVEEQIDHGNVDTEILRTEVIPDLLVFAAQLAAIEGVELAEVYKERLEFVAKRNGASQDSTAKALILGML